jgi:hypothetical protein
MNYTYEIINNEFVIEIQDQKELLEWSIRLFYSNSSNIIELYDYHSRSEYYVDSYYRTKTWVLENYPELLI